MAPDKKRTLSPTGPPVWFSDFILGQQESIRRQELAVREIRLVTLENQHMLRVLLDTPSISSSSLASSTVQHRGQQVRAPSSIASAHASATIAIRQSRPAAVQRIEPARARSTVRQNNSANASPVAVSRQRDPAPRTKTIRSEQRSSSTAKPVSTTARSQAIASRNAAVRNAAVPLPRISRPADQALPRICWFHKQFGQASVNCLQPCTFTAPVLPQPAQAQAAAQPVRQAVQPDEIPAPDKQVPAEEIAQVEAAVDVPPYEDTQVSSISARLPLERQNPAQPPAKGSSKRLSVTSSSSSDAEQHPSTSKNFKSADWNDVNKHPSSSSSASSDSD